MTGPRDVQLIHISILGSIPKGVWFSGAVVIVFFS